MDSFLPIEISASGLNAQRLRLTTIASNLANVDSTRSADGPGPYQRRTVTLRATPTPHFDDLLDQAFGNTSDPLGNLARGVLAETVIDDSVRPRLVYEPGHPDADANGFVAYPGISVVEEMTNMIAASRSYEANLAAMRTTVSMIESAMRLAQ